MNIHHKVAIVTLSRYPDLLDGLTENLNKYAPHFDRVVVKDGYLVGESVPTWLNVQGPDGKFVYSVNANLGLRAVDVASDIILIGDDVRLETPDAVEKLYKIADENSNIGLLSTRINGGADNPDQTNPSGGDVVYTNRYIALVCTYIKRSVLDKVGYLDESFKDGWGWDDVDYSRRVKQAGYTLAVASKIVAKHGVVKRGSESLIRNEKGDRKAMQAQDDINSKIYFSKWKDTKKENW